MNTPIINYTNRDFASIKQALLNYAKQYYPDTFKDFSKPSFGAMLLDHTSYIGDMLSFFLDFQANEVFMVTAQQNENISLLARERGYRDTGRPSAQSIVDFFIIVPANTSYAPDPNYTPILLKDSALSVLGSGAQYLLVEDVDFAKSDTQKIVSAVDDTGKPTFFALKQKGKVVSGGYKSQTYIVTSYEDILQIKIDDPLMSEIISVTDSNGHEYFQVDYLSQNAVYKYVKNLGSDSEYTPYKLAKVYAPRRFTIENIDNFYYLVFGNGSTDNVSDPRSVVLDYHARDFISETKIDPTNIIESDKFGIGPTNTTLTIIYRSNNVRNVGAAVDSLSRIVNSKFRFPPLATNQALASSVRGSLEVNNPEAIASVSQIISGQELKRRGLDAESAQLRAVTAQDLISFAYRLPPQLGAIKRANAVLDLHSFKRNINMYIVSEDQNKKLITCNSTLKENLKTFLSAYKIMNDSIDILDAIIVNLQIEFKISTQSNNPSLVAVRCVNKLKEMFNIPMDIGQGISISAIYKALNSVKDVTDTKFVKLNVISDAGYNQSNFDIISHLSADGSFIECPSNMIFEFLYPDQDFKVTAVKG